MTLCVCWSAEDTSHESSNQDTRDVVAGCDPYTRLVVPFGDDVMDTHCVTSPVLTVR